MSVKRYDSNGFESEYGIWVRAVDYDALVEQHSKSGGDSVTVPKDPTQEMTIAGMKCGLASHEANAVYRAMLAAYEVPKPGTEPELPYPPCKHPIGCGCWKCRPLPSEKPSNG